MTAAWRASGLGVDDERIDAMVARARASGLLPETRLRAMRLFSDNAHENTATTDTQSFYTASGERLWLEARLTWRFDRLLYADDEPTLERVRLERQDARARLAAHALELLFAWQRAELDRAATAPGSREMLEATLRSAEAEARLDALTGGWFTAWRAAKEGTPP